MADSETGSWKSALEEERRQKDDFMARHPESPFVSARVPFHELRYFPPDPALRIRARLVRVVTPQEAYLRTNRDGSSVMRYIGDLVFAVGPRELKLRVYHAGEGVGAHVFVPFRDATSGRDSYGPGRYLTLELNPTDSYELDFNRAFNPYCAYTDEFECGFPPAENDLPVPIRAGEKVWAADHNPRTPSSLVLERTANALGRARPPPAPGRGKTATKKPARPKAAKKSMRKHAPSPPKKRARPAAPPKGGGKAPRSPSPRTGRPRPRAKGRGRGSSP
ncbi:MAG TPA: DUF1684 domain-containing protein [Thermoplasmata archaeon]|nr:DUF1684 domain-containing protein [Thermoplasmata archaeon]